MMLHVKRKYTCTDYPLFAPKQTEKLDIPRLAAGIRLSTQLEDNHKRWWNVFLEQTEKS